MNMVACGLCGFVHVCSDTLSCDTIIDDGGYPICRITGFAVQGLSHCSSEHIDTVGPDTSESLQKCGKKRAASCCPNISNVNDYVDRIRPVICFYVTEMMMGPKWDKCSRIEAAKQINKKRNSLYKYLKEFKLNNRGLYPNMALATSFMMNNSCGWRNMCLVCEQDRIDLVKWCADVITKHVALLHCVASGVVSDSKLKNLTIGLLYQIRNGVVMNGIVLLPKSHELLR